MNIDSKTGHFYLLRPLHSPVFFKKSFFDTIFCGFLKLLQHFSGNFAQFTGVFSSFPRRFGRFCSFSPSLRELHLVHRFQEVKTDRFESKLGGHFLNPDVPRATSLEPPFQRPERLFDDEPHLR